jgi:hypothetical protein
MGWLRQRRLIATAEAAATIAPSRKPVADPTMLPDDS